MKNSYGVVHLKFSIKCPYCDYYHHNDFDKDWFDENCPELYFENAGEYDAIVKCKSCEKDFKIEQFEY